MDDISRGEVFETLVDISDERPCFFFRHGSSFFEQFLQGAIVAELSDEIAVIHAFQNLVAADGVGVVQRSGNRNFLFQQFF